MATILGYADSHAARASDAVLIVGRLAMGINRPPCDEALRHSPRCVGGLSCGPLNLSQKLAAEFLDARHYIPCFPLSVTRERSLRATMAAVRSRLPPWVTRSLVCPTRCCRFIGAWMLAHQDSASKMQ